MDINITIKDEGADALAQLLHITTYKDGNDLIQQCVDQALMQRRQRALITGIAMQKDAAVIDAVATAFTAATSKPLPAPMPPIKLG